MLPRIPTDTLWSYLTLRYHQHRHIKTSLIQPVGDRCSNVCALVPVIPCANTYSCAHVISIAALHHSLRMAVSNKDPPGQYSQLPSVYAAAPVTLHLCADRQTDKSHHPTIRPALHSYEASRRTAVSRLVDVSETVRYQTPAVKCTDTGQ